MSERGSSRQSLHALVETATAFSDVTGVIHAAGVSPSQASPAAILAVDLYRTAVLLEEFGNVIARWGAVALRTRLRPWPRSSWAPTARRQRPAERVHKQEG